jgi:prepilin-type N-terminal cleavage/methylation domain-containing protein
MSRGSQRGMTLIEVLIAVTLVSLLSVGMLFAIRVGFTSMEVSNRRIISNRRNAGAHRVLEQQLAGFLPVRTKCIADGSQGGAPVPYFQGMPGVMRFVTTYSLQGAGRGQASVVEMFVIPMPEGTGVRLVMNEMPYLGPVFLGTQCMPASAVPGVQSRMPIFPDPRPGPRSFVLADRLAFCRFSYLEDVIGAPELWVPIWRRMDFWPKAVRIEMAPLDQDPTRIPPLTFTGRIRPNLQPMEPYEY